MGFDREDADKIVAAIVDLICEVTQDDEWSNGRRLQAVKDELRLLLMSNACRDDD